MIKDLVYYGSSGLRKKCDEVTEITDEVKQIAQDLIDTVIDKDGLVKSHEVQSLSIFKPSDDEVIIAINKAKG